MQDSGIDLLGSVFHPDLNRIQRGDESIRLSPKSSAVLKLLVAHAGQVQRREEILDQVWAGRFPTDDVLTHAITELRRALGDPPASPRFIETIPKVGYRLLVTPSSTPHRPWFRRRNLAAAASLAAVLVAGAWVFSASDASRVPVYDQTQALDISVSPPRALVSSPDNEYLGAVSPDGAWLAYARFDEQFDLYLHQVSTGVERRLTETVDLEEGVPAWDPRGGRLLYREIGPEDRCRLIWLDVESGATERLHEGCYRYTRMDFTPDGRWLAFTAEVTDAATPANLRNLAVFRLRTDGSHLERVSFAETPTRHDIRPRYSPDGRWLAFLRTGGRHDRRLMIQRVGERRAEVVNTDSWITSFDWHPNGRVLLMSAHRFELYQLEALDLARRSIVGLEIAGVTNVVVHPNGRQVIYQQLDGDTDIWQLQLDGTGWGRPEPLVTGPGYDFEPTLSGDQRWLAYCSTRSGLAELYALDLESGEERQLTHRTGGGPAGPVFSPDNRHLAFLVQHDKSSRVWLADLHESRSWPLEVLGDDQVTSLSWSPEGRWLYYVSERSGDWRLWRLDMLGGPRERLTDEPARRVQVAADGRVYFSREDDDNLYQLDPETRDISVAVAGLLGLRSDYWVVAGDVAYFAVAAEDGETMELARYDLASESLEVIAGLGPNSPALGYLTVSRDGSSVYFDRLERWNIDVFVTDLDIRKTQTLARR